MTLRIVHRSPAEILEMMDLSSDHDPTIHGTFTDLMEQKYDECSHDFVDSILRDGIRTPVMFFIDDHGHWVFDNGHHRLAVAIKHGLPLVPTVFDTDGDYEAMWDASCDDELIQCAEKAREMA